MIDFPAPTPSTVPTKYRKMIQFWDDERNIGNSLIVTLHSGFYWQDQGHGSHVRGEDSVKDILSALRCFAKPCNCQLCKDK